MGLSANATRAPAAPRGVAGPAADSDDERMRLFAAITPPPLVLDHVERALDAALAGWETRIPTGRLNAFLGQLVAAHPHPLRGGKQPRILFGTQVSTRPPRFVLFTTGFLDPGYRRFIERRMREDFGFDGSPIQISVRVRERRRR